ncbi:hypothetical protein QTH87_18710 [Variovorax sp. J22P168]|uniref:hypothetical protein n=1 Tax=Variovorax jilinensis TaxID=3053513 RepID=UPI0025784937|nr:hypothetical protein [Variovorax sp. J22P168]MDM0014480.1 hypothetical protein [Variovorax sp. J22P168]
MAHRTWFPVLIALTGSCVAAAPVNPNVGTLRSIEVGASCEAAMPAIQALIRQSDKATSVFDCASIGGRYAVQSLDLPSTGSFETISIHFRPDKRVWRVNSFTRFSQTVRPPHTAVMSTLHARFGGAPALIRVKSMNPGPMIWGESAAWSSNRNPAQPSREFRSSISPCRGAQDSAEHYACMQPQIQAAAKSWDKAVSALGGVVAVVNVDSLADGDEPAVSVGVSVFDSEVDPTAPVQDEREQLLRDIRALLPRY